MSEQVGEQGGVAVCDCPAEGMPFVHSSRCPVVVAQWQAKAAEVAAMLEVGAFRAAHRWSDPPETATDYSRAHALPVDILDRLRDRYAREEVPPCRVCGGELSIGSMGGGAATVWAHAVPEGTNLGDWMEHYRESRWTQYRSGDSEVLALVDLVERLSKPPATPTTPPAREEARSGLGQEGTS